MFKKRIFTLGTCLEGLAGLAAGLPESVAMRTRKGMSHAFAERLRLAVTSVNDCAYCTYVHSTISMRAGMSKEQVDLLLGGGTGCEADAYEAPAIIFAHHYAETGGHPEKDMLSELKKAYGEAISRDIIACVREIEFANLSGNTFEAFLNRLSGDPAKGSSPLFELVFFIASLPILGPMHILMKAKGVS